jgi:hypothetical protein
LQRREAPAATEAELGLVHTADHVRSIRELSSAGGGPLDTDTYVGLVSFRAALHAAGGACAMVRALTSRRGRRRVLRPPLAAAGERDPTRLAGSLPRALLERGLAVPPAALVASGSCCARLVRGKLDGAARRATRRGAKVKCEGRDRGEGIS